MGVSIRHNSIPEAAQYLHKTQDQIREMIARGEIETLRLGGEDYVALDVISEGRGPRRYEGHRPGQVAKPTMPPATRSRPKRRK